MYGRRVEKRAACTTVCGLTKYVNATSVSTNNQRRPQEVIKGFRRASFAGRGTGRN